MKFCGLLGISPLHDKEYNVRPHFLTISLIVLSACSEGQKDDNAPEAAQKTPLTPVAPPVTFQTKDLTLDATQKAVWVRYGLRDGELIPMTPEEPWIIGVSRYMWQTNTGSSGPFAGGAYEVKDQSFDAIDACDSSRFVKDIMVPPLGSVHEGITSGWWNIADPLPVPLDTQFVVGRDKECIKLKLLTYEKGLYTLKYQHLP